MSEKITVYIPVYNGANFIECAIDSILSQTYKNYEIIVSDNKSTDNTVEIVKRYMNDKRIKLIEKPRNTGMLNNGNDCLRMIKTKYFMGICHDDYFYDDRALEIGVSVLEANPEYPVVYCDMMFVDACNRPITKKSTGYSGEIESNLIAKKSIISGRNLYSIPLLIRTSAIREFTYSDEYYHTSDIDFSIWIGKNQKIYYLPDSLFALRFHGYNNTARKYDTLMEEYIQLANKYNIHLNRFERAVMRTNHYMNYVRKSLFYFYLDKIRR
ncbi:MAG: glycosyltransferase [Geobacteraceae bacterium]|nr:glycosyltransferase [Geobacteraceae bacterium]